MVRAAMEKMNLKMDSELRSRIVRAALHQEISAAEFMRRGAREKLAREFREDSPTPIYETVKK